MVDGEVGRTAGLVTAGLLPVARDMVPRFAFAECHFADDNPLARFWRITFEQLQDQMLEAGLLTPAESEDYRALLDSPEYRWMNPVFMSVWGRRVVSK
jgi:hypothetical protein